MCSAIIRPSFDLAVVNLKLLSRQYLENYGFKILISGETLVGRCRCAMSFCDLDLTFNIALVPLIFKILSMLYLRL